MYMNETKIKSYGMSDLKVTRSLGSNKNLVTVTITQPNYT